MNIKTQHYKPRRPRHPLRRQTPRSITYGRTADYLSEDDVLIIAETTLQQGKVFPKHIIILSIQNGLALMR